MKWLLMLALVGCMDAHQQNDDQAPYPAVPEDTHYIYLFGYATIDDCLAQTENPWACARTLTLCTTGQAGIRLGDVIQQGDYTLIGSQATIEWQPNPTTTYGFDVNTLTDSDHEQWSIDYDQRYMSMEFDNISCE
ncbi:MAG: hypothetical protein QM831_30115 [Kofleriaceae bacterium]